MKVSVITVCYNSESTIADALGSVARQTHPSIEHVIVDGASTDGTLALIRQHARPGSVIISEPDKGIYDAMNKGLRAATGDLIGFLNADDVFCDERVLEDLAQVCREEVQVCYGDIVYVDKNDMAKVVRYYQSGWVTGRHFRFGLQPAHPSFYVRRGLLEQLGGFDLELENANDFEFILRYLKHLDWAPQRIVYLPRVFVRMRLGGHSNKSLGNILWQNRCIYTALNKHGMRPSPWYWIGKILMKARQFIRRPAKAEKG